MLHDGALTMMMGADDNDDNNVGNGTAPCVLSTYCMLSAHGQAGTEVARALVPHTRGPQSLGSNA